MTTVNDALARTPGVRLSEHQERTLRSWPLDRIRPKSIALGLISLCAEIDHLRAAQARHAPSDARCWRLGDNGDGRQWWTILTDDGEIVAQALSREDAQAIVAAHNAGLAAAAPDDDVVRAAERLLSAHSLYFKDRASYDRHVADVLTVARAVLALRAERERLVAALQAQQSLNGWLLPRLETLMTEVDRPLGGIDRAPDWIREQMQFVDAVLDATRSAPAGPSAGPEDAGRR